MSPSYRLVNLFSFHVEYSPHARSHSAVLGFLQCIPGAQGLRFTDPCISCWIPDDSEGDPKGRLIVVRTGHCSLAAGSPAIVCWYMFLLLLVAVGFSRVFFLKPSLTNLIYHYQPLMIIISWLSTIDLPPTRHYQPLISTICLVVFGH